ncbi:glycosyltransferase family 2 protein [Chloroflexota bacterium]
MTAISIIMPCYNRAYDLKKTLAAYEGQVADEPFEVIAIDDGSSDDTYSLLSAYQPNRFTLRVVRQESNQGPAAARNRGMGLAKSPIIMFVGDDIVPDKFLVRAHLAAHRRNPEREAAILGRVQWARDLPVNTLMTHIDGVGAQQFSYNYFQDGREYDFRHFYTANISLKREMLLSTNKGFDTDFHFAAFEDVELSYRLSKKGLRIIYAFIPLGYHYHYHDIWTFSTRQYQAGLMACVLTKKHPEVKNKIFGKRWYLNKMKWLIALPFYDLPKNYAEKLEKEIIRILSKYEWDHINNLDYIYYDVFYYFFYKGVIKGTYGDKKFCTRIHNIHAKKSLQPIIDGFKN